MDWRFYARRTVTGEWLHTNVGAAFELTTELNGSGFATGVIPAALDVEKAPDGRPLWWERGTTLYAELNGHLEWVGLCSFTRPTASGREVEFKGLTSAYDLIGFDGILREWEPDPFNMVRQLISNGKAQANGDVGLQIIEDGRAPTYAGDEQPPRERPEKVKRQRGESKEHFAEREEDRAKEQQQWDKDYGERRPYLVAWWEAPYIGEELRELAREIPFDWYEQHRWTDRDNLEARHDLVLTPRRGRERSDVRLVEGVNIGAPLDPSTDTGKYGNHVVMLGAGEGRKMRRAEVGAKDGRVRTTRYGEAKHVWGEQRLRAAAREKHSKMGVSVTLDEATLRGDLGGLDLGDSVEVESSLITGWCRVFGITRSTTTDTITLSFAPTGGGGS